MYSNGMKILLVAGLVSLAACTSQSVMGPSGGGGIPMPPGGGIPSPGGGGIPSPGGGIPSPGGGIPSPGGGSAGGGSGSPSNDGGGGIPAPGEGNAGIPGGSGGEGGGGGDPGSEGFGGGGDSDVFGSGGEGTAGSGGGGDEFDRALEDFDNVIGEEQEAIARESGQAADEEMVGEPGSGVMGGSDGGEPGERAIIGGPTGEPRERTAQQVEGCNDQDTVARQLCEAATMEQDPFLRAALWDEYNEYKRILGRL